MIDHVGVTMLHLNDYYKTYGNKSAADPKNTPAVFARGLKDIEYFDWMAQTPAVYANFNQAMAFRTMMAAKEIAKSYPFGQLVPRKDGVVLVDVGGGRGHVLNSILESHPSVAGHAVLQDLEFY